MSEDSALKRLGEERKKGFTISPRLNELLPLAIQGLGFNKILTPLCDKKRLECKVLHVKTRMYNYLICCSSMNDGLDKNPQIIAGISGFVAF